MSRKFLYFLEKSSKSQQKLISNSKIRDWLDSMTLCFGYDPVEGYLQIFEFTLIRLVRWFGK